MGLPLVESPHGGGGWGRGEVEAGAGRSEVEVGAGRAVEVGAAGEGRSELKVEVGGGPRWARVGKVRWLG